MPKRNPKELAGMKKWRHFTSIPLTVLWEIGVGMMEGAFTYGRHNYRRSALRTSIYIDAAMGHLSQYWEGEDNDQDSKLSHVTKAISTLVTFRDAMIRDNIIDDRPPKSDVARIRDELQKKVDALFEKHPNPEAPFTEVVCEGSQPVLTRVKPSHTYNQPCQHKFPPEENFGGRATGGLLDPGDKGERT